MVKAWYMDKEETDQRLEHHRNPPEFISLDDLYMKTGVEYFTVSFIVLLQLNSLCKELAMTLIRRELYPKVINYVHGNIEVMQIIRQLCAG